MLWRKIMLANLFICITAGDPCPIFLEVSGNTNYREFVKYCPNRRLRNFWSLVVIANEETTDADGSVLCTHSGVNSYSIFWVRICSLSSPTETIKKTVLSTASGHFSITMRYIIKGKFARIMGQPEVCWNLFRKIRCWSISIITDLSISHINCLFSKLLIYFQ